MPTFAMSDTPSLKQKSVSVRALSDFNQIEGSLIGTFRPSPSAFEGQQTHTLTQQKRPESFRKEVTLSAKWLTDNIELTVKGRADCTFPNGVEEIKSTRIPPEDIPSSAKAQHLIQARLYGALLCLSTDTTDAVEVRLTYVHPQTLKEWSETEVSTRVELIDFFVTCCARYEEWLALKELQTLRRDKFVSTLKFPFAAMREGQRQMAESVYKSCCLGKHLTVEAPTGTGKTLAALFPALKAMPKSDTQSLFFLTMKTTGRVAATDAIAKIDSEQTLAVVQLSAKNRLCLNNEAPCDGEFCPYAKNYFSKRAAVRNQLFSQRDWQEHKLIELGKDKEICPYYLSQDWAIWADVVIGDLNYIYDTTAVQPFLLKEIENRATLLIDESHNLIDRGRMIYSCNFEGAQLQALLHQTPKKIGNALKKIQSKLRSACRESDPGLSTTEPKALCQVLRDFIAQSPVLLRENPTYEPSALWQDFIFLCARFARLNELADAEDFRWRYSDGRPADRKIELICLNPATLLGAKHDLVNNVVAFSATLKPWPYSNYLNGLSKAVVEELPSPFAPSQFDVYIASDISTRFRDRNNLPAKLNTALNAVCESEVNSMVFFSSYQQLNACLSKVELNRNVIIQQSDWAQAQRDDVLAQLKQQTGLTLMTVLGGVFAEGIDLPGTQLEQVVIVGPGLPQVNDINNSIRQVMDSHHQPGFEFAYLFPGLQKVLQAVGRCVRNETDKGSILLIDDRFEEYRQRNWLPSYWSIRSGPLNAWPSLLAP